MKFQEWFIAQHGRRPGGLTTDAELERPILAGERARTLLQEREDWDMRRTAALYAWQARDSVSINGDV